MSLSLHPSLLSPRFSKTDIPVTPHREHGAAAELQQGKNIIAAVKANLSTVKTFIWSGIEHVSKVSGGKYTKVEHFDTKVGRKRDYAEIVIKLNRR